ncbi:MAG: hypothetical protein GX896_08940 [Clostridiales bacterium]|nr:hypothetical protein [Clostridiales bacterium]
MARQKGIIKLKGAIGDISFYKSKDGYLAREKGGVEASRIANDPAFARTRENGAEFGHSASAGKLLRDAVRVLGKNASDNRVTARLTKIMSQIKNLDEANERGERSVAEGLLLDAGKALLKGFNFNVNAVMGSVLYAPYGVDIDTGKIRIESLITQEEINYPPGATHVIFKSGFAVVDFENGNSAMTCSDPVCMEINGEVDSLTVIPEEIPQMEGTKFILFCIEFVQEVNRINYSLKNGAYNVLAIVEVV